MKRFLSSFLLVFLCSTILSAQNFNLNLLGTLSYNADLSDIWGYTDGNGHEYAIVGVNNGTSIVDISTDPSNPVELHFIPGVTSTWRDIKVWGDYAYVTTDFDGAPEQGLLIIDLSDVQNNINYYFWTGGTGLSTAHNIFIDENGYAYLFGANIQGGGAMILDLNVNPYNPTIAGYYTTRYIHDGFVRNDTMWSAEINDGIFSVVDVTDKANPVVMATHPTPSTFTHNLWLSDDGATLYTTDEVSSAYLAAYDVSNLNNIYELDRIQSSPGSGVIPHNTFVKGDFLVTSYYRDGITIHDVTYPNSMILAGWYDSSPFAGDGFNGCWGVYPYFASELIIASDIEMGLFVLGLTYVQAAYLDGTVTDSVTAVALNNVQVEILGTSSSTTTDITGIYGFGTSTPGTYDVHFSKAGYYSKTITGVSLTGGSTVNLDVELREQVSFTAMVNVTDMDGNAIPNAMVNLKNNNFDINETANAGGIAIINPVYEESYTVSVGSWGYVTSCQIIMLAQSNNIINIQLETGYYDDFSLNLGWTTSSNASTGDWERAVPNGTSFNGQTANPDSDVNGDCGDMAYVTGNAGGGAGDDDIDDGTVILRSPLMDGSSWNKPELNFSYWFFNDGGNGNPNDYFRVRLSNGNTTINLETITQSNSNWIQKTYDLEGAIVFTSDMRLIIEAVDQGQGHLTEAGFDHFRINDTVIANDTTMNDTTTDTSLLNQTLFINSIRLYPNPVQDYIYFDQTTLQTKATRIEMLDVNGKQVKEVNVQLDKQRILLKNLNSGIYYLKFSSGKEILGARKIIVSK